MSGELLLPTRPALRFHGAKWRIAPWLISLFPAHRTYVEPFCGSASILLRKERSPVELINDLDSEVTNLFQVLRDSETAIALARSIELTPYGRDEFTACYEASEDAVERARRLVTRSYMGFGSHSFNAENSNGFRIGNKKRYAVEWANYPQALLAVTRRLVGVGIENQNALKIIPKMDGGDTFYFLDPPYCPQTRNGNGRGYAHEMSEHDHCLLAHVIRQVHGKVMICGYPSSLYDEELFPDWTRREKSAWANGQQCPRETVEVVWMNYEP